MPRTKVSKNATAKRPRNQVEEANITVLREIEKKAENFLLEISLVHEQIIDKIKNRIRDIQLKLNPTVQNMTMRDLFNQKTLAANDMTSISAADTTTGNQTNVGLSQLGRSNKSRICDEGYLTEESGHSSTMSSIRGRPLGPLASAKAKSRRSRSMQKLSTKHTVGRSNSTISAQHQSRTMYKTPGTNRIQTMSADRCMATVTPKMQPNMPVSMLRYQRMGETIISMDGSPVIAQGTTREGANINIPVGDGVISVLPTAMSGKPNFLSQIRPETLEQLKMLQTNLDLMISHYERS